MLPCKFDRIEPDIEQVRAAATLRTGLSLSKHSVRDWSYLENRMS